MFEISWIDNMNDNMVWDVMSYNRSEVVYFMFEGMQAYGVYLLFQQVSPSSLKLSPNTVQFCSMGHSVSKADSHGLAFE